MRRVAVTGIGIVSSIGNNADEVLASLREAKSGISFAPEYAELGFRCRVHGAPQLDPEGVIDRKAMRFHGGGTAWYHVAMDQAIVDSGLCPLLTRRLRFRPAEDNQGRPIPYSLQYVATWRL